MTSEGKNVKFTRRQAIQAASVGPLAIGTWLSTTARAGSADLLEQMVIDLAGVPESIDPALSYSAREWSVVHSIYDSVVEFGPDGIIRPLAAQSFTATDATTFEITLREGLSFHDGSPVTSAAISRSVTYMQESGSSASSLFAGITEVLEVDELTAQLVSENPSPWLPAQLAPWLLLLPEGHTLEQALEAPIGSGPYMFESQEQGNFITLVRNPDYTWDSPKGSPIAERVTFRFVPEPATRIADLTTGASHIITEIPVDQLPSIEDAGAIAVEEPVVASAFIRIATDVEPFDQPGVRQALNHAIDVDLIASSLVSPVSRRLGSLFPDERSMAFNPDVVPYAYDPELARELLQEAGVEDGLEVVLEVTSGARLDVAEAIAMQFRDVGLAVSIRVAEYADFNATWGAPEAPALRMVTWGPLYDPHTLLSLVFARDGYLSRYHNDEVDRLINKAAIEPNASVRADLYQEMTAEMAVDPPAIFLWNLTSGYGVAEEASEWQPRGDEYVIPTAGGAG